MENSFPQILGNACPLIHHRDPGAPVIDAGFDPHLTILWPIAYCIAHKVHKDLQSPPELTCGDGFSIRFRRNDADLAAHRLDQKQPRRPLTDIGQVHILGRNGKVQPVDRLQIGKIVYQSHQMTPGRSDIGCIARIIRPQRPLYLRIDRIRIGNDPPQWLAQRSIKAPPKLRRIYDNSGRGRNMGSKNGAIERESLAPIAQ